MTEFVTLPPDRCTGNFVSSYRLAPEITEWCAENDVDISVCGITSDGPYIAILKTEREAIEFRLRWL